MKLLELVLAWIKFFKLSSKDTKDNYPLILAPAPTIETISRVTNMPTNISRSKSDLRNEIQLRINGIAEAENGVDRVVIVTSDGIQDFVSGDGSISNNEDLIVNQSILFASRALTLVEGETDVNASDDDTDYGKVEVVILKRENAVFSLFANNNPDFSIVYYGSLLLKKRYGPHSATVLNVSPKLVSLYKEMLDAY
jgi:hypothetical protein